MPRAPTWNFDRPPDSRDRRASRTTIPAHTGLPPLGETGHPPSPGRRYSPSMPDALRTPETPARSVRTIRQRPSLPPSTEVILNSKRRHGYQNGDYHEIPTFKGLAFQPDGFSLVLKMAGTW